MKKIIGIVMVLMMLMSVTVALADVNKDAQPDKTYDGSDIPHVFVQKDLFFCKW